jgi:hypothetical protein
MVNIEDYNNLELDGVTNILYYLNKENNVEQQKSILRDILYDIKYKAYMYGKIEAQEKINEKIKNMVYETIFAENINRGFV